MQHLEHWTLHVKVTTAPVKKLKWEMVLKNIHQNFNSNFDFFFIYLLLMAFSSFLVIEEKKKNRTVCLYLL